MHTCISTQVPLGIILKGEQKYEEMIEVLTHLSKYVPTVTTTETVPVAGEEPVKVTQDSFHTIALGRNCMLYKVSQYSYVCLRIYMCIYMCVTMVTALV